MGIFNFKKKDAPKVEQGFTNAVKADAPKEKLVSNYEARKEEHKVAPIISTDCAYDKKKKTYVYSTGIIPNIKEGYSMIVRSNPDLEELNQKIVGNPIVIDNSFSGELFLDFKPGNGRFTKQPYNVGDIIANFIIIPTKDVNSYLKEYL